MCDIVCVQYRGFGHLSQPFVSVGEYERQGPNQNPEVSVERPDSTYRPGAVEIHSEQSVVSSHHARIGQVGLKLCADCHWSRSRATAAVRGRESLVQIHMHNVDA